MKRLFALFLVVALVISSSLPGLPVLGGGAGELGSRGDFASAPLHPGTPAPLLPITSAPLLRRISAPQPSSGLYRTRISVRGPADWARLESLGVTVLDKGNAWALVLADDDQLEALARLRFEPQSTDELGTLVAAHAQAKPWLATSWAEVQRSRGAEGQGSKGAEEKSPLTRELLRSLTSELKAGIAALASVDDDADGLTNTEEAWWCTDPMNPNSDGDAQGYTDGQEVHALLDFTLPRSVRWGYGPPFGPPNAWPNFNDRNGTHVNVCNDGDKDTIPDYAEVYMVGTRVPEESTDHDKFDDGQELFGTTFCPGDPPNPCWGVYPAGEYWNFIQASMPNWVRPPGDNPFVAAFPIPEVSVQEGSWKVDRVTTITTQQGQLTQTTQTYGSEARKGQRSSIADTRTWNEWEEVSTAIERPLAQAASASGVAGRKPSFTTVTKRALKATNDIPELSGQNIGSIAGGVICGLTGVGAVAIPLCSLAGAVAGKLLEEPVKDLLGLNKDEVQAQAVYNDNSVTQIQQNNFGADPDSESMASAVSGLQYSINQQGQAMAQGFHAMSLSMDRQTTVLDRGLANVANAILAPRITETRTDGKSWGGAQTVTNEEYEEHALTEQNAFTTGENWSTAWAVDSSRAATLVFTYTIQNTGTEYARELTGLIFNVYLNDELITSYPAWQQFPNGKLENLFPNSAPINIHTNPIPLTLDQMRQMDTGGKLRIVVEDYSYGADELFYQNAVSGGMTVYIEDGVEDGDESVDMYVIPTWGTESVQDLLTRYFPAGYDTDGLLNSLWTPEFDGINPPVFHEHFLSNFEWWNVYLTQPDAADLPLRDLPAQASQAMLIRISRDSDRDGYQDRVELRYGTDKDDAASHPNPEILAGYVVTRAGNQVTVTLALENSGTFDAYGVQATMYSPDATTTVNDNIVGGNGRVRPGRHVAVGSLIQPPTLSNWSGSTARPYAAGDYTGPDRTFTFNVSNAGTVGTGSTAMTWTDSAGGSGSLDLGSSYHAPLPRDVRDGLQIGFNTGVLAASNWFTVTALSPRDTLRYTINTDPNDPASYTEPVIVVSYNDPHGNTQFVTPVKLTALGQSLVPFSGQMLKPLEFAIRTHAAVTTTATNRTTLLLNSPHPAPILGSQVYLDFLTDGARVLHLTRTLDVQPGPNLLDVEWSTSQFSQPYDPAKGNLLIAHWTDSENNIIDTAARPLNLFLPEAEPTFAMADADATWDFGTAQQGTVLKRTFTFANTGFLDLLTYVSAPAGLTVSQTGSRRVGPADMTTYEIALNAADLPVGPYDQTITIRTSDPNNPTRTVHVMGTITTATPDTSPGALQRPLDWPAAISGNQGDWVEFTHTLGPEPQTLHPVKVYSQDYSSLKGIGKYATAFGSGLPWWNFNYQYRRQISVRANTATPANYPVKLTLDTNSLQSSGKVRADRADWRVVYWTGSTWVELDRYAAAVDQTWFPTAVALNAGSVDSNYFVYYGYPSESQVPPANPARVFPAGTDAATAVSYYFLEGTGSTSADYSPTGAPFVGLGENAVWAVPSGRYRGGLYLTGNGCRNGWISPNTVPNVASITIEIWVYPTLVDGQERWLLGKGNEADHYQYALIQNAGNRWQVGITDNQSYWRTWWDTGVAVAPNAWSHLAFTYDSATGNLRFYLNGVLMAASNAGWSGSLAMTNYAFLFGNLYNLNHPYPETCNRIWRGYVSNLRISGIVRTDFSYAKLSPTTDPSSEVTGEQGVYVVEQVESAPYDRARLNLPEPGSHTYQVQYGRKLNWGGAANQVTSLRVPAGLFTSATLQALVSGLPSNAWFALDVGNTGSDSWNGTVGNGGEYTSPNLAAFFNAYWANHGAPTTGYLDVPVRVYLDRAGQVLLTNLQMIPSGSKLRYVRLPVQNYSNVSANFTVDRLFFDDFSAQVPGRWTVAAGTWQVNNGVYDAVGAGGGVDAWAYAGDQTWTDYSLRTRINMISGNGEVVLRSTGHWVNEYRLEIWSATSPSYPNIMSLVRYRNGTSTGLWSQTLPVNIPQTVNVQADIVGDRIQIYLDGVRWIDLHDPEGLTAGRIGLGVIWNWHAQFDDVEVVALDDTPSNNSQGGSGPLTVAADVGDNGTVDWKWVGSASYPRQLTTDNLASAFNAYLSGRSGDVDVPVRFYLAPFLSLHLDSFSATPSAKPDATLTTGDIGFSATSPTEGDTVTVNATLHNASSLDSGRLTASFFATPTVGSGYYIGSAFVANVPANSGTAQASIPWNTLGFTGNVPVRVVADPFNRVAETNENNNQATASLSIKTRPDLQVTALALSDDEPVTGQPVTVRVTLRNSGQTAAGASTLALYDGNPDSGGTLLGEGTPAVPGGGETALDFTWTPTAPGPHRLFALSDRGNVVKEYDEGNNDKWQDVYVGFAGPLLLDSGTATDPAYTPSTGYGFVDEGLADVIATCGAGSRPEETLRRDPGGRVVYRFDHLLPGHFYHLDLTLYECDGAGRQESVYVDGNLVAGPEDLGDGQVHRLSLRLDPALYADHVISVTVEAPGIDGAVVSEINLHDIDYRYADAGGANDPQYVGQVGNLPYGWLDGVASTAWGTLPYKSVRVEQSDNELRYRFDGLSWTKKYNVHLTFWQGSGTTARIQKVQIDGVDTGTTVNVTTGVRQDVTVPVPLTAYQSDGSIIVGIVRTNATIGAMVNEIALEEETINVRPGCIAPVTPSFSEVYGSLTINGAPAPIGTVVQAISPRGDTVGCFSVTTAGQYGLMRIYGEDATANPPIPGMRAGELVAFRVNGASAVATPLFYWHDDKASHRVDLAGGSIEGQVIPLKPGWNLISLQVEPPAPLVNQVLNSISNRYDRVLGETGVYSPTLPDVWNTLKELHSKQGYYLRLTGSTSANLLVEGLPVAANSPIALHQGWNWIGYLPQATLPVTQALQSIAGLYQRVLSLDKTYDPALPNFSTLKEMKPGEGYLIYMNQAATLTYPAGGGAGGQGSRGATEALELGCPGQPTPYATLLYGTLSLNGAPAPAGTRVEVVTSGGEVAGCFVVVQAGQYGLMHVYGQDATAQPPIPGFQAGEPLRFRVNGLAVAPPEPLIWQDDKTPHRADLVVASGPLYRLYLPLLMAR